MYDALCRELDELLIEIIENMEEHVQVKRNIEQSLQNSFYNIAKTRYISGSTSVTNLQLPTQNSNEFKPQATVQRSDDESCTKFVIENNLKMSSAPSGNDVDPIRLFGILVPQSLKLAQKSSIIAIDKVGEAAEIQASLENKISRYSRLLEIKTNLI